MLVYSFFFVFCIFFLLFFLFCWLGDMDMIVGFLREGDGNLYVGRDRF